MKMDIAISQSWWWESHSRPKHSRWLQENLADVAANVQTMLSLIEGDADSFAQRAEMYYKKRPDLLKVVEQFSRGYRALAERYDQLNGSVRQVPSALQAQYGLTIDSPRTSPFGKLNKKQFNSVMKDSNDESKQEGGNGSGGEGEGESLDASSMDDKGLERSGDTSSSSSDAEYEGASLEVQRLQKTVEHLQAENKKLMERSREKQQQYRETEKRLHGFREDFLRTQKDNNTLKAELAAGEKVMKKLEEALQQLHLENESSQHEFSSSRALVNDLKQRVGDLEIQNEAASSRAAQLQDQGDEKRKELTAALRLMHAAAVSMFTKNKALLEQISGFMDDQKTKQQLISDRDAEVRRLEDMNQRLDVKVTELRNQVSRLEQENEEQRITGGEEKREVIRQLCYTIDLMNERNQWLERMLSGARSKLIELQKSKTLGCGIFA